LSVFTLGGGNELNAIKESERSVVWIKNCDPPYAIFKRLNLEPKTQIG
jgi:hypothetical protein